MFALVCGSAYCKVNFVGPNVTTIGECKLRVDVCGLIPVVCIRRGGVIGVGHVGYTLADVLLGYLGDDLLVTADTTRLLPINAASLIDVPRAARLTLIVY